MHIIAHLPPDQSPLQANNRRELGKGVSVLARIRVLHPGIGISHAGAAQPAQAAALQSAVDRSLRWVISRIP